MTKQEFIEALQEAYAQKEKARLTKANKDLSVKVAWQ